MWKYPLDRKAMDDAQIVLRKMGIISKSGERDRRPTLAELDRIMFGLVRGTGFWRQVMIPWYRLDLRILVWMEEWDERFAGRYSR